MSTRRAPALVNRVALSTVLVGAIRQVEYHLSPLMSLDVLPPGAPGAYQMHEVVHARKALAETGAWAGEIRSLPGYWGASTIEMRIEAGEGYCFPKRRFHATHHEGLTITVVRKYCQEPRSATILAPVGVPVVHAFADPLPRRDWEGVLAEARDALWTRR